MASTSAQGPAGSVTDGLNEALDRQINLHNASRIQKAARIGGKLAYSTFIAKFAGKPHETDAKLFWGGQLQVVLPESVSTTIYRYGFFEADVSHMFLETLKPGMTFYDVGAHIGYFSCLASYLVGPRGQVHSFEPTPTTFEVLTANTREKSNIKLNNVAVFSSETQLTFKDFGITHSAYNSAAGAKLTDDKHLAASRSYQVRTTMLDEYAKRTGIKPDMIKIDAENAEFEILSGMRQLLREAKPVITLEVDDTGKDPESGGSARVIQLLEEHGYTAFEWRDNRLEPHVKRKEYGYGNLLFRAGPY